MLAREFGASYTAEHFTALGNFQGRVKLLDDGAHQEPFLAKMLPPWGTRYGGRENIIRRSRERYGRSQASVEDKIKRWMT